MEIVIHLPERSEDYVSESLRELTKRIEAATGEENGCYGLGGSYGYGENFENDTFKMHRFCWCERDECPWCAGCNCDSDARDCDFCTGKNLPDGNGSVVGYGAPHFWHKPTDTKVWWYKYIGRGMEVKATPETSWEAIFADCFKSLA